MRFHTARVRLRLSREVSDRSGSTLIADLSYWWRRVEGFRILKAVPDDIKTSVSCLERLKGSLGCCGRGMHRTHWMRRARKGSRQAIATQATRCERWFRVQLDASRATGMRQNSASCLASLTPAQRGPYLFIMMKVHKTRFLLRSGSLIAGCFPRV